MTTDEKFTRLARSLRRHDLGRPQVVIDVAALERNVDRFATRLGDVAAGVGGVLVGRGAEVDLPRA